MSSSSGFSFLGCLLLASKGPLAQVEECHCCSSSVSHPMRSQYCVWCDWSKQNPAHCAYCAQQIHYGSFVITIQPPFRKSLLCSIVHENSPFCQVETPRFLLLMFKWSLSCEGGVCALLNWQLRVLLMSVFIFAPYYQFATTLCSMCSLAQLNRGFQNTQKQ